MRGEHEIQLTIEGMTCATCVRRVEKALNAVPGVEAASVNFATGQASVRLANPGASRTVLGAAIAAAGYRLSDDHTAADREEMDRARRSLLSAVVPTLPLLVLAMSHGAIPGTTGLAGAWAQWLLATPVVFGPGRRFMRMAWSSMRQRSTDMNTLVSIGILAAWSVSTFDLLRSSWVGGPRPALYLEAAAGIVCFLLLGRLLETRARRRLGDAVRGLEALRPATVQRLAGAMVEPVPLSAIVAGDQLLVRPGERIPVDGVVRGGSSTIDASLINGESMPLAVGVGAVVAAGCLNLGGALEVEVVRTGDEAAIGRIVRATAAAQSTRPPIARMADRLSAVFVPVVLAIAGATFLIWLPFDAEAAVLHAVAVLVIACPCALGLATPAAIAVGTGRAAELGVLFTDGAAIEVAAQIDTVLLDKTGTVTSGRPQLAVVRPQPGIDREQLLELASAVAQGSTHPLAVAIASAAPAAVRAHEHVAMPGRGTAGFVDGVWVALGNAAFLTERGVDSQALAADAAELEGAGMTSVLIARGSEPLGVFGLVDAATAGATSAVSRLRALGVRIHLLSGDRPGPVQAVARQLHLDQFTAEANPADKAAFVARLRGEGRTVAMVGDGLNDTPALAGADLGVAVGGGAEVAAAAAGVVLQRGGVAALPDALVLARRTLRAIRQNLAWAFIYNLLGIPLAAGVLVPFIGLSLSPLAASAAMALSSVSVLANSLRLRHVLRT